MAFDKLRKFIYRRINIYMHREMKVPLTVGYDQIRIYPTAVGFLYLGICLLLFILGINYQNNLIIIICCLMLSVIPYIILDTYKNIRSVVLEPVETDNFFAGQSVRFRLHVTCDRPRFAIKTEPMNEDGIGEFKDTVNSGDDIGIIFHPQKRGWLHSGAFVITTTYPFGIICSHIVVDFHQKCLIYPRPVTGKYQLSENASSTGSMLARSSTVRGLDELSGLRPYREGEPPSLIAWKQVAMNRGLMSKDFTATVDDNLYLDFNTISGNTEERISVMTYAVLQLSSSNQVFGIKIGQEILKPDHGEEHRIKALTLLALWGNSEAGTMP
jgi:uncharacterized protein (DUF58 family)